MCEEGEVDERPASAALRAAAPPPDVDVAADVEPLGVRCRVALLGYGLSRLLASCSSCSLSVCSCATHPRSTEEDMRTGGFFLGSVTKTTRQVLYLALQTSDPLPMGPLPALQDALGLLLALPQTLRLQVQFLVVTGHRLQEALCVTLLQLRDLRLDWTRRV